MGAAKWVAVGVLGAASVAGMTWTIAQKYSTHPRGGVIHLPATPPPAAPPAARGPVQREILAIRDAEPESAPETISAGELVREPSEPEPERDLLQEMAGVPQVIGVEGPTVEPPAVAQPPTYARIINLNTAPAAELELLPGIGPALAGRIVDYRDAHGPFRSVDELMNVRGIGPKTLEKLQPRVRVQ